MNLTEPAVVDPRRGDLALRLAWWAMVAWLLGWGLPLCALFWGHPISGSGGGDVGAGIGMAGFLVVEGASGAMGTFISSAFVVWAFRLKRRSIPLWIAAAIDVVSWVTAAWMFWELRWMLR
jgi:hypothetical protein